MNDADRSYIADHCRCQHDAKSHKLTANSDERGSFTELECLACIADGADCLDGGTEEGP